MSPQQNLDLLRCNALLHAQGTWCSGITSASHADGPGFKSQCVHLIIFGKHENASSYNFSLQKEFACILSLTGCRKKRQRGDSNPCGQSPMDFESISLTARTNCHCGSPCISFYLYAEKIEVCFLRSSKDIHNMFSLAVDPNARIRQASHKGGAMQSGHTGD